MYRNLGNKLLLPTHQAITIEHHVASANKNK